MNLSKIIFGAILLCVALQSSAQIWPIKSSDDTQYYNRISGTFGEIHPTNGVHFHGAVDIDINVPNCPVRAVNDGRVNSVGSISVELEHLTPYSTTNYHRRTRYLHVVGSVTVGSSVSQDNQIAIVENNGAGNGDHLHFEMWEFLNGEWYKVNPFTNQNWNIGSPADTDDPEVNDVYLWATTEANNVASGTSILRTNGALTRTPNYAKMHLRDRPGSTGTTFNFNNDKLIVFGNIISTASVRDVGINSTASAGNGLTVEILELFVDNQPKYRVQFDKFSVVEQNSVDHIFHRESNVGDDYLFGNNDFIELYTTDNNFITIDKHVGFGQVTNGVWFTKARSTSNNVFETTPTEVARYNEDAKYRDGVHSLQLNAIDASGREDEAEVQVVVDNFRPYVKEVIVRKNHAEGTMAYRAYWQWNGTVLTKVIAFNPIDINPQENVWLKITTSEPVNNLRINVPAANGSTYTTLTPIPNTNDSEFTYCLNPIAAQQSHQINIQAEDLAGNSLQTNPALIPIRQANGTWSTGVSPGVDSQHFFNVGTGTCGDGSSGGRMAKAGRTSSSSCLYADFSVDNNLIGSNESVTFSPIASGSGALTYSWNFGAGATPSTSTSSGPQTVIYTTAGAKTVSLTICDGSSNCITEEKANLISVGAPLQELTIDFSKNPAAGEINTNFQLTSIVTGAIEPISYSWTFGEGVSVGHEFERNPVVSYTTAGNKSVSLTITDATGRTATQVRNGFLYVTSFISNIQITITGCNPNPVNGTISLSQFVNGGNGPPYGSYMWDFGDGTTEPSTGTTVTHGYKKPGRYTIRLTVCDASGCGTAEEVNCITIASNATNDPIYADFAIESVFPILRTVQVGLNTPVSFVNATTGGGSSNSQTYSWDFESHYYNSTGKESAVPATYATGFRAAKEAYYTTTGLKEVSLTASSIYDSDRRTKFDVIDVRAGLGAGRCFANIGDVSVSTNCYSLTNKPKFTIPVVKSNCPVARTEVFIWPHEGEMLTLPNGILDFEYLGITPVFPYTALFSFEVQQFDGVSYNRIGYKQQMFTFYGPVDGNAGPDKNICLNSSIDIGPGLSDQYTYKWSSPTAPMTYIDDPTISNPKFSAIANGQYTYNLLVTDKINGCTATDNLTVTVNKPQITSSKAWAPLGVATPLTATASSGFGNYTYNWVPATRLSSATVANPNFTSAAEGNFEYLVTVTDQTGCTASTNVSVNASSVPGNLVATAEAYERISLKWIDRSFNETSFVVQRSLNGGTFSTVATVSANVITFDDVNVLPSNTYTYKVAAIISGSTGTFSNEASVSTASLPAFTFVDKDSKGYADLDGDGDMDYVRITVNAGKTFFEVMQNAGGTFVITKSDLISNGIINHELIMARFGDFDNDNDLDILLSFYSGFSQGPLLYINTAGTFVRYNLPVYSQVPGEAYPTIDYTSDNDVDLVVSGSLTGKSTAILENIGTTQFQVVETGISGVDRLDYWHRYYTMIMAADTDNDGDQDLIMPRSSPVYEECQNEVIYLNENDVLSDSNFKTVLWRNASNPDLAGGQDIVDFDNDGIKDILKIGKGVTSGAGKANLWKGDGSNNFTEVSAGQLLNVSGGQTQFGDYDMDGDYDVFVSGDGAYESYVHRVYTNNNNSFSVVESPTTLLKEWVDFEGDGDLDILAFNGDIYRNNLGTSLNTVNTQPTVPSNLCVFFNGTTATFTWDPSTDGRTLTAGLTYNLYVKQNGTFVLSPLANLTTGFRKIVARGNVDLNTSWTIKLPGPGNVEWGVQAIDNSFTGSVFAHSTVNPV